MGAKYLFLSLLALSSSLSTCAARVISDQELATLKYNSTIKPAAINSTKWQPHDFNWEAARARSGPKSTWKGLSVNLNESSHARAFLTPDKAHFRIANVTSNVTSTDLIVAKPHELIVPVVLAWFAGLSWATIAEVTTTGLTIAGTVSAIQGCVTDDGSNWGTFNCIVGLAGSIWGVGQAAKAAYAGAKALGWFARSSATWLGSGLEAIELSAFTKRGEMNPEHYQIVHERLVSHVLNQTFGSSEFIGYAGEDHRLGARHDEHLHPRAPIFRFSHPRHGLMDIASREHVDGTRFTITFANGLEEKRGLDRLGRRQTFQHEALNGDILEARFDEEAANADPCNPSFDAQAAFGQIEDTIGCFTQGSWPDNGVLKAQLYDSSCEATFGFIHMGFFANSNDATKLENLQPAGMPLTGCEDTK
ncbi:hypothetical protein F4820DRAFT_109505 [Hypoxylon rubiginosum]|uniref:Uncharacterized protein n=1 Tax=Hypoxylon rubiginosum TaxID=110542 RepID=A0ACB9YMS7_9PEZI|nr:hypothetical protein F4820DRAFT_109505 [Hypoxylon rubiginosum]